MEICYDGALVMPRNYSLVSEKEMTYVEGGGALQKAAYYGVEFAVNCAVMAFLGGGAISCVRQVISSIGTGGIKKAISSALVKWVARRTANLIAGSIAGAICGFLSFSVGGAAAEWLDRHDGCNDKQIYFSKVRF